MTDEGRIVRTLAFPLLLAFILLFVFPRMCSRAAERRRARMAEAQAAPAEPAAQPSGGGLHIHSLDPNNVPAPPLVFPPGLDAQRMQYLIEVDRSFSEPATVRLPKPGAAASVLSLSTDATAMVRLGYFERVGEGFEPTRDGRMHLDGLQEDGLAWQFPVGTRVFRKLKRVDDLGDGRYRATFVWEWQPNDAGRAMEITSQPVEAQAEFGGGEHHWDLTGISGLIKTTP